MLGVDEPIHGYDIDRDACATATAARFTRTRADVALLEPAHFPNVQGLIMSLPCPTLSEAGRRTESGSDAQTLKGGAASGTGTSDDPPRGILWGVSLPLVQEAARKDTWRPQSGTTPGAADHVRVVESALYRLGLLARRLSRDGSFGSKTVSA